MGSDIPDGRDWTRTPGGELALRPLAQWEADVTDRGDIALSLGLGPGNHPAAPPGEPGPSQFICSRDNARQIAHMILRTLAFCEGGAASDFYIFRDKIKSTSLCALADDWNAARQARRMPSWGDVRPSATAPYLGGIWAFDYHRDSGEFTGRLAGSNIVLGYQKNYIGVPMRELYPPHVYEMAHAHLLRVVAEPGCALYSGKIFKMGERIVEGERLILPMGAEAADGVLAATYYDSFPLSLTPGPVEFLSDIMEWHKL